MRKYKSLCDACVKNVCFHAKLAVYKTHYFVTYGKNQLATSMTKTYSNSDFPVLCWFNSFSNN